MNFTSFDAVFFTAGFLVPGFIWSAILSMLLPKRETASDIRFLQYLTLSCINHGLWAWLWFLIFRADIHPYLSAIFIFGIVFASPAILGLLMARSYEKKWPNKLLNRFGFKPIDPIPTAWDSQFNRREPRWVTVVLKNGMRIYGFFGARSFAGDDPKNRDLYLEAAYRLLQNGEWAPLEDTGGVLIMADQIVTIEFRKLAEENNE